MKEGYSSCLGIIRNSQIGSFKTSYTQEREKDATKEKKRTLIMKKNQSLNKISSPDPPIMANMSTITSAVAMTERVERSAQRERERDEQS